MIATHETPLREACPEKQQLVAAIRATMAKLIDLTTKEAEVVLSAGDPNEIDLIRTESKKTMACRQQLIKNLNDHVTAHHC